MGDCPLALEPKRSLVQKLLEETGITEAQALELISLLGSNWSSLVREAKAILDSLKPPTGQCMASSSRWHDLPRHHHCFVLNTPITAMPSVK